jgi:hypothetical protein
MFISWKDLPAINSFFGIILYSLFAYIASFIFAYIFAWIFGSWVEEDPSIRKKKLEL